MIRETEIQVRRLEWMYQTGKSEAEVVRELASVLHEQVGRLRAEGLLAVLPRQLRDALQPFEEEQLPPYVDVRRLIDAYREVGPWSWSQHRPEFHVALIAFTTWVELAGRASWDEDGRADAETASV